MSIWFYLFLIVLFLLVVLTIKYILIKKEIKNIIETYANILKSDTNNLITVSINDKQIRKLVIVLNKSLKELRKLEIEYKNGSGELKTSITNISHDLRTPLTAIRGYLDLMGSQSLNKKQINYLKIIDGKVKDLIELTEQLFDFSKSISIPKEVQKENVCVNDILEETLISFYSLFKEKNVTPKIEICDEKVIRLLNENMVKRIFENIISNAIKYGKNNFYVKLYSNGKIEFSNETDLLDKTSLEKIFDRYYTVRSARKSNGIGLSIAKQLVDLCGGQIQAFYINRSLIVEIIL